MKKIPLLLGFGLLLGVTTQTPAAGLQVSQIKLAATADAPELFMRVAYPTTGRRLPVVLFSHGAYSSRELYNAILEEWAARAALWCWLPPTATLCR